MTYRKEPCTIAIIVVNIAVFIGLTLFGRTEDGAYMLEHGAMYVPYILERGEYYRMFTCLFLHFGIAHLGNNMLILFAMGTQLEGIIGKMKFLIIYMLSGLSGNVLSFMVEMGAGEYPVSAGASGAIFGVVGAMLYIALRNRGTVGNMTGKRIMVMLVLSLYLGFTSTGVDNYAHIGGVVSGFLLAAILYWKRNSEGRSQIHS